MADPILLQRRAGRGESVQGLQLCEKVRIAPELLCSQGCEGLWALGNSSAVLVRKKPSAE